MRSELLLGKPFYPFPEGKKSIYPACEYTELYWFRYLFSALASNSPITSKPVTVLTWDNTVVQGNAVLKADGTEPTLLVLDGVLSGVVAANIRNSDHRMALKGNSNVPAMILDEEMRMIDGLAMRPFLPAPSHIRLERALFNCRAQGIYGSDISFGSFPELMVSMLSSAGLPVDKRRFLRNSSLFDHATRTLHEQPAL